MSLSNFEVIDLNFQNTPQAIACYLTRWERGAILVETGPASCLPALQAGLARLGIAPQAVTDVLLTHIHLDHAGAAWWCAERGAQVHVHPLGAPHLIDPSRLLDSARRLYGEAMDSLWGELRPIPAEQVHVLADGGNLEFGDLRFEVLDTPGHANHHMAYRYGSACFTGDVAGVRLPGTRHIRLPTPPPEFLPEKWRASVARLEREKVETLIPTHFGMCDDAGWHLNRAVELLDEVEAFMQAELPSGPTLEALRERTRAWITDRARADGLNEATLHSYETALPSATSADGMMRYWVKFRGGKRAG